MAFVVAVGVLTAVGCSKPSEFLTHPYTLTEHPELALDDPAWAGNVVTVTEVAGAVIRERIVMPSIIATDPGARIWMTQGSGEPVHTCYAAVASGDGGTADGFKTVGFDILDIASGDVRFIPADDAEALRSLAEDNMGFGVMLTFSGFDPDTGERRSRGVQPADDG
ncbi:MAG: hypothetical protein AAFR76_14925 [Planctomycetota bacterium]